MMKERKEAADVINSRTERWGRELLMHSSFPSSTLLNTFFFFSFYFLVFLTLSLSIGRRKREQNREKERVVPSFLPQSQYILLGDSVVLSFYPFVVETRQMDGWIPMIRRRPADEEERRKQQRDRERERNGGKEKYSEKLSTCYSSLSLSYFSFSFLHFAGSSGQMTG